MKITTQLSLTAGALAIAMSGSASAFIIDDFQDVASLNSSVISPPTATVQLLDQGLTAPNQFTSRDFTIANETNPSGLNFGLDASIGVLSITKGANSTGKWSVLWDGATVDFTLGGLDSVKFTILENNGPSPVAEFSFSITDLGGNAGTFDFSPSFVVSGSPEDHTFLYSDFTNAGDIDFTQITEFGFDVDSQSGNGVDLQLAFFETVDSSIPIPGTILLLGAGLVGMSRLTKKREA